MTDLTVTTTELPAALRGGGTEVRCPTCGRVAFHAIEPGGRQRVVCYKCKMLFEATVTAEPVSREAQMR